MKTQRRSLGLNKKPEQERIEQLEFKRFDRLGIRLFNEYWTLEGPSDSQIELEL